MNTLQHLEERDTFVLQDLDCLFWRVKGYGALTEYKVVEVHADGKATCAMRSLVDLKDGEYKLTPRTRFWASSTFGLSTVRSPGFYLDQDRALEESKILYNKEMDVEGRYRVVRYFDDVPEKFATKVMSKKKAYAKAIELNQLPRFHVHYGVVRAGTKLK